MVAAPGMLLNAGKKLEEACAARAVLRDSRATVTCPARRKGLQSCLVRYSTTFLCRVWTDLAWELKLEGLSALFSYF